MKEQYLNFFKNQKDLQRNSFGDIRRECFFREMGHFFERTRLKKRKEKKTKQKGEETLKEFHRKRWKNTVKEATE